MRLSHSILLVAGAMFAATMTGCATTTPNPAPMPSATQNVTYRPATAAALAFDPPMTYGQQLPDMSRDGRSPSAFMGYEDAVTTVSSTFQRDEIRNPNNGSNSQFDRQAFTSRTSVTTR